MEGMRPEYAVKAIVVIIITLILFQCVCATNHTVGGTTGWDLRSNLQMWSAANTFLVGDDLGTFSSLSLLILIKALICFDRKNDFNEELIKNNLRL